MVIPPLPHPVCTEHQYGLWEGHRRDSLHLHRAPTQVRHRQHSGLDVESRFHHSLQEYPFSCPTVGALSAQGLNMEVVSAYDGARCLWLGWVLVFNATESSCRALTWVWLAATPLTDGREALRPWVEDAVIFKMSVLLLFSCKIKS